MSTKETALLDSKSKIKGTLLHPDDRKEVLAAYVHRFTKQNKPVWARQPKEDGTFYSPHFEDDDDWLGHTYFAVDENQRLKPGRWSCQSFPTWPDNPELREGYVAGEEVKEVDPKPVPAPVVPIPKAPFAW